MPTTTPAQKREQEKQVVGLMIELYCHGHHGTCGHTLCPDCEALRNYADARVDHCPHMETKTFCSACKRTATSPKCAKLSARSCAGAARGCSFTTPYWQYAI